MHKFALLPYKDRTEIINETANKLGISNVIVEKDFWVCWMLDCIFSIPKLAPFITFKGGTSLSKAYGIIERFSEDIDLVIDKEAVGIDKIQADFSSNKMKKRYAETVSASCTKYVQEKLFPILKDRITELLGKYTDWHLSIDEREKQNLHFHYPKAPKNPFRKGTSEVEPYSSYHFKEGYIKPQILLEFGARGEGTPKQSRLIGPLIAKSFPQLFIKPTVEIPTLAIERTFWEKVAILHSLHHSSAEILKHKSRHYYDVYMLTINKEIMESAFRQKDMLQDVIKNSMTFFASNKSSYETAKIGSLRLMPKDSQLSSLKHDYEDMQMMFMGNVPVLEVIINAIKRLELEINNLT